MLSICSAQAQTTDGYLTNGDYVTISFEADDKRYYLQANNGGLSTVDEVNDYCLWQLGITQNNSNFNYTFKDLTTNKYLGVSGNYNYSMVLNNSATAFYVSNIEGEANNYMFANLYYRRNNNTSVYITYDQMGNWYSGYYYAFTASSRTNNKIYIEKWEQKGSNEPTAHFSPSKIEYTYVADNAAAQAQATNVDFIIEPTMETYYQCVNRPDEVKLRRQTLNVDLTKVSDVNIYWASTGNAKSKQSDLDVSKYVAHTDANRTLMTLSNTYTHENNSNTWQFTIVPNDSSPMGLKDELGNLERWIDYADNVVVEYKYNDTTLTPQMRVVRKSYHRDTLPALSFSINPMTYTFAIQQETKNFDVTLTHQHGTVLYNVDNQVIQTIYTDSSYPVSLKLKDLDTNVWSKTFAFKNDHWLTVNQSDFTNGLSVTASKNETRFKRTDTLVVTIKNTSAHPHEASFEIPLHQRGVEGGIQFRTKPGVGNIVNSWDSTKPQPVHTAERTIYYLPNEEIELRLPESGYSGYMRWYDYETGMDPYYNEIPSDSTDWILSPRAANGSAFSAINTPLSANTRETEGRSYGYYAINKADGGVLDQDNVNNPAPRIKGWNYQNPTSSLSNKTDSAAAGYHTMACDVSAYTDYRVVYNQTNTTRVDTIVEPTLSYRQLFHLKPAKAIADTIAARTQRGKYFEEYHYQAPAGKQVLLSTEYRYRKYRSHISEMCYFYKKSDDTYSRISANDFRWQVDGVDLANPTYTAELDYLIVRSDTYPAQKTYTLTANPDDDGNTEPLLIAKFIVDFVDIDQHGPTTKTIITQQRIDSEFKRLDYVNFDNYSTHLPWNYTTYGYVYTSGGLETNYKRNAQDTFPFYGEYTLLTKVEKNWAKANAHNGKSLYVDGTMEPGLVATLFTDMVICSGQTLYCSAWFCNPSPAGWSGEGNPIFRCNVQGRNNGGEWENAGVYFVGELLKGTGWQQVMFPIESAHSYDETRVSIYNFATTNQGNDFMVDDINLYVSQLPIAAYQGKMACRTTAEGTTSAAAVLRLDYSKINAGADGYIYYQIFNDSYQKSGQNGAPDTIGAPVSLVDNLETAQVDEGYYHDNTTDHDANNQDNHYGSVHLPAANFNPAEKADSLKTAGIDTLASVSKLLDNMVLNNKKHAKAFVRTVNNGVTKWLLYVAHIVENTKVEDEALSKLYEPHNYSMRMAYNPDELAVAVCNMTTPLYATQQTVFTLRNSDKQTINHTQNGDILTADGVNGEIQNIFSHSLDNCANDLYFLTSTVVNNLAISGISTDIKTIKAPIYSDWLVGDPLGDVFSEKAPTEQNKIAEYNQRLQEAATAFQTKYGYTHGQVATAIMYDMRRFSTDDTTSVDYNPNYYARTFEELEPSKFLSMQNYEIVKHLYENEWLQLYDTTVHFYLGGQDTARYWCFPIVETAKATVEIGNNDTTITIKDCNEPHRVYITSTASDDYLNIAPIAINDKTAQQKLQLPKVNVLQPREGNLTTVTIPVCKNNEEYEIGSTTKVDGLTDNNITIQLSEATFFDLEKGKPYDTRPTLEVGEQYTLRLQLKDNNGDINISGENSCRVGYVFATIQIVPNTLVWQPTGHSFNGWGKNENWKGWKDDNSNGIIEGSELITGYVPMEGADVVIPDLNNPLLYPYIVPEHDHDHYPMTVHHDQHKCRYIYLAPGAHLNNQHLLDYEKAFVDMPIPKGNWYMMSSPLQDMYSGDMFIPHSGGKSVESANPFEVSKFSGQRSSTSTYAFWASYYNQAVKTYYDNGIYTETPAVAAEFQSSNSLVQPLPIGSGFMLWGEGLSDTLVVRLPKPDTYYTSSGDNKYYPQSRENVHKFAFTANHEVDTMQITLTNEAGSEYFLFGNPTMAFINMHDFLHDNEAVLNHVFYRIENGAWNATAELTMSDDRFLAPMTSVMLETKDKEKETSLSVTLKASHLTLNNQVNPFSEDNPAVSPVAPRRSSNADTPSYTSDKQTSEIMTIYAFTQNAQARTVVAANPLAYDYYQVGEDAIFISSGVENQSYVTTPLNMYTVAEQVPMMADVRQGISNIPLAMLIHDDCRTQHMQLAFYLSPNWTRECYLHDTATGQKMRIMDGLVITVDMPQNHEQRYIIEGPDQYIGSNNNDSTTTSVENNLSANADEATVHAYSVEKGTLTVLSNQLIEQVKVYNLTGQLMLTHRPSLLSYQLSTNAQLPTGVCVVEATLHNGATLYTQTIVK